MRSASGTCEHDSNHRQAVNTRSSKQCNLQGKMSSFQTIFAVKVVHNFFFYILVVVEIGNKHRDRCGDFNATLFRKIGSGLTLMNQASRPRHIAIDLEEF